MAKKASSKPTTKSKVEVVTTEPKPIGGFSILSDETALATKAVQLRLLDLSAMRQKNPRPAMYASAAEVMLGKLPVAHPWQHWFMDNIGWSRNGLQQLVGDTGTGKTTKVLTDAAHIMFNCNAPVLYLACEGLDKSMEPVRMLRCMHHDPDIAMKLLQAVHVEPCMALSQLMPKLRNWAASWRDKGNLPKEITLVGIVDPYSRLMSNAESAGNMEWDKISKEEAFEMGTGNNFGHAKFSAQFSRVLQGFCNLYNVCLFVVHHRTDKVDFAAGPQQSYMPEWLKRLNHHSKLGGSGLDGLASTTQILVCTEKVRDPVTKVMTGKKIRTRMLKQSHGADERTGWYELRTTHNDGEGRLDHILRYDAPMCELLNELGLFGVTISKESGLATCSALGLRHQAPEVISAALRNNPELMRQFYRHTRISGSYSLQDLINQVKGTEA